MTDDDSDAMLDRLDRGEPAASKEEADAREPYERLISQIRELPDEAAPPDGWESRLEQRWHRQHVDARRSRRWLMPSIAGALAAAAALIATLVMYCRVPVQLAPTIKLGLADPSGSQQRGSGGLVGNKLSIDVTGSRPKAEVRIYRDDVLWQRFDLGPARRHLEVVADKPGTYRALLINSDVEPPPPSPEGYRGDLLLLDAEHIEYRPAEETQRMDN